MASRFTTDEWRSIRQEFDSKAPHYGLPKREYGSVLLASFNVRKLGSSRNRNANEWAFLADIIRGFDLVAVQEVGDDLSGLRRIMELLGPDYSLVVSDQTGVYPGVRGNLERLGFIYRWSTIRRKEMASDITFDRSHVLDLIADNLDGISEAMSNYIRRRRRWLLGSGSKPRLSSVNMPVFLTFIRQPHCVSFEVPGIAGTDPIEFLAVNAHLFYGARLSDRQQEIEALVGWIIDRLESSKHTYAPNFILLGDLNFDYNNPATDRPKADAFLKSFDGATGARVNVNFPFLDRHSSQPDIFRTNARKNQTYDQIGLFGSDNWVWSHDRNGSLPDKPTGPDYGMFDSQELFSQALFGKGFSVLSDPEKNLMWQKSEYKVSDHMPIWIRLPLPR